MICKLESAFFENCKLQIANSSGVPTYLSGRDLSDLSKICVAVKLQFTEDTAGRRCNLALVR